MDSSQVFKFYIGGQVEAKSLEHKTQGRRAEGSKTDSKARAVKADRSKSKDSKKQSRISEGRSGYLRDNCHQTESNTISIEKRMPINIFNIRNVNYLKTESREESSPNFFKNEIIKQSGSREKREGRRGSKHRANRTVDWAEKSADHARNRQYYQTHTSAFDREIEENSKKRNKSIDSKSLMQLMSRANHVKNTQVGAKLLFQKIVKGVEKTEGRKDKKNIEILINHLHDLRNKNWKSRKPNFFLRGEKTNEKNNVTIKSELTETCIEDWEFTTKTTKLAKDLASMITEFQQISSKRNPKIKKHVFAQTPEACPKEIQMCNFNTPNLIKEYSRAFMLHKKSVNPDNESGSEYLSRVSKTYPQQDIQMASTYRDIFSLEQEHLLVEESLKMLQEKGFDVEAIFMAAYEKLKITGNHHGQPSHREESIEDRIDANSVSFESCPQSTDAYIRDTNCYLLDFDRLDQSTE